MISTIRFFQPPAKSYFLFGPRGTGKSTWIKTFYPNATIVDLLQPETYRAYQAHPERLRDLVLAQPKQSIVVLDEIQKIPTLLDVVHELIEMKRGWMFVLTGSSSRKLKRSGVNLLAGRAAYRTLHPFMAAELGAHFDLAKQLQIGMLPLVVSSPDPMSDLAAYIALYMKEEVQMEGIVRHVDHFARFLEIISFSQGSTLNCANIARECHISQKTAENYVQILEDLLLSFKVPVFTKKAKRILSAHPKFYYFDAGVFNAIRPKGLLDQPEEIGGITLETLVMQHCRAWLDYSEKPGNLFFWRTKSGVEVDAVIYGEIGFYALEVKNTQHIRPADLKGLRAFQEDYPQSQCILLYRGTEKLRKDNILCYPVDQFLQAMQPNLCLPE